MVRLNQHVEECTRVLESNLSNTQQRLSNFGTTSPPKIQKIMDISEIKMPEVGHQLFGELDLIYTQIKNVARSFSHAKENDIAELVRRNLEEQENSAPIIKRILICHCEAIIQHIKDHYPKINVDDLKINIEL